MNWKSFDFYPVMGEKLTAKNTLKLDFSPQNEALEKVDLSHTASFTEFVFSQLQSAQKKFGFGGYLEQRAIYRRSEVFATAIADFRNIHLGIDIWCDAGTPVFCPWDGVIHSFQDNAGFGNYGPTIIVQHDLGERTLFSLYGHLFRKDLDSIKEGQHIRKGEILCHVGPYPENGDWPPHLHFQLMWDMMGNWGDFPGVASQKDLETYAELCPDPNLILGFDS
ncbi:peptidoglycan DD-metalloendopeptidase family protein [Algoriphagus hitonicola]|uniref:Peptidase family M23 n=1 Tax=Algoriphagus hitonicola TaxID=435880 RepID=A0A1I2SCL4_9BACT|nr:peptidoglycan DD-metalloendopeptidase family protein [Algoriphagus hitonicola]SFG48667.1 Peptidase family M23 [Algoriphagus hitonicola]